MESGDLKTAFLSGDPDPAYKGSDALYIDPPSDLKRWLKLGPEDVLRLRKAVYGLINAPLRWHQRLSRALRQAGFVSLQMDPCVWILPASSPAKHVSPVNVPTKLKTAVADSSVSHVPETQMDRWKRQRNVQGVLGVHVDDLLGGGNLAFQKAVQWLRTELEFGTWEQSRFRFRGRELCQEYNRKSIKISMSKFAQEMEPVSVPKHVKDDLDAPLEANVHSQFRAGVGQLQWLQMQGNPLLSFATGILQSRSATPNGHDLLSLNKLMREAKSMPDLCWWIVSVPSSFVWLTAADAAWANRPDGSSTSGHVIMAAHPNILRGESSTVSVLAWNSRKIRRVVRSSLGAECAAFSTGLEHTDMFRVLYGELCGDLCDLAEYETYLQMTDALCVNDCKSLADAILAAGSAASKTSEDKRLGIELSMIKQRLSRNETRFQWVEGATMPADVLTKVRNEDTSSF